MLIRNWRIRIQSDGRPAITFPKGRQDVVLLPEAGNIELSDEGVVFIAELPVDNTTAKTSCSF